jgi:hypothetical protein
MYNKVISIDNKRLYTYYDRAYTYYKLNNKEKMFEDLNKLKDLKYFNNKKNIEKLDNFFDNSKKDEDFEKFVDGVKKEYLNKEF